MGCLPLVILSEYGIRVFVVVMGGEAAHNYNKGPLFPDNPN